MWTFILNGTRASAILALALFAAAAQTASAQVLTNGGFEAGFSGWTRADQLGSNGTFALQSGTLSPVNGIVVPAPPGGATAASTGKYVPIPARYSDAGQSGLTYTIQAGPQTHDLELEP